MKAIYRYNIANCIGVGETKTYSELADACGLAERPLKHLLRHGMTMRFFTEPTKGVVAHTAASQLMQDPNCMAWLEIGTEDLWPSSVQVRLQNISYFHTDDVKLVNALAKWPESEEPNQTGWNIAHNAAEPMYQRLATDTAMAKRFGAAMTVMNSNNPAFDPVHIHRSFDWESLGSRLVVDVGGSHGNVSISLAQKYPHLRFISQDLASVIEGTPPVPSEVSDRVQFMAHDFFTPQPEEADVYIFRWILHNHSDKYAILILRALIPALKQGARILVQDGCLPDPGKIPNWREKDIR